MDDAPGTVFGPTGVRFSFRAPPQTTGVRLVLGFDAGVDPEFVRVGDRWELLLPRPPVDRLEYRFEVRSAGGAREEVPDPGSPGRVPDPHGERSEILFPGYRAPRWLGTPDDGILTPWPAPVVGPPDLRPAAALWRPTGLSDDTPADLLVVHDGRDLACRGSLLRWVTHRARVTPLRVLLLDPAPGRRSHWYSADERYADAAAGLLAGVRDRLAVGRTVGLGVSLGAVATMTLHRRHPRLLEGLALQSGSFFTPDLAPQESGFEWFDRLCAATAETTAHPPRPVPTLMTVGTVEENRANNEALAAGLAAAGWDLRLRLVRDAHTVVGWRDAWFPDLDHLLDLVADPGT